MPLYYIPPPSSKEVPLGTVAVFSKHVSIVIDHKLDLCFNDCISISESLADYTYASMRYTSVVLLARTVGPHWPQILFHFGYQLPTPLGTSCHDGHLCSPLVGCDCLSVRDIGSSHRYWILTPNCTLSHAVSYTFFARTSPDTCSQCAG